MITKKYNIKGQVSILLVYTHRLFAAEKLRNFVRKIKKIPKTKLPSTVKKYIIYIHKFP